MKVPAIENVGLGQLINRKNSSSSNSSAKNCCLVLLYFLWCRP